jgi:hypothetical protein
MNRIMIAAVTLLAIGTHHASAQSGSRYSGVFNLLSAQSDDLEAVIKAATARMNFITRPIARSRLKKTNSPYRSVEIAQPADSIAITYEGRRIAAPATGASIPWKREDGEKFEIWMRAESDRVQHHFKADDGERLNEFLLSAGGDTLSMLVTVTSPRLPAPLTYRLVYVRKTD